MAGLWLASLALAVEPGAGSSQSVNAVQGPCARMVEFAVGRTSASGRTAVPDKDVLAAYCRSSWPERAADCDVLAAGMVREAAPGTGAPALRVRFCGEQAAAAASKGKPASRAAPRPSLLSSLAAVFFPVRSKHGEAWGNTQPLETARSTVTVAIPPVDTSGILARRDAVLAASSGASAVPAGRAVSAAAAAGVAATEAAAPKKALAVVAQPAGTAPTAVAKSAKPKAAPAAAAQPVVEHAAVQKQSTPNQVALRGQAGPAKPRSRHGRYGNGNGFGRKSSTHASRDDDADAPWWRRALGFLCDYQCFYSPRRSLQIVSMSAEEAAATDDDN